MCIKALYIIISMIIGIIGGAYTWKNNFNYNRPPILGCIIAIMLFWPIVGLMYLIFYFNKALESFIDSVEFKYKGKND